MKYVGMHSLIRRNNRLSVLLLLGFPTILLAATWLFVALLNLLGGGPGLNDGGAHGLVSNVNDGFLSFMPWVVGVVALWFIIAYFTNTSMIRHAVRATPLARMDNPRLYNIVENLTMACGMNMPQVNIVNDPQLNAFASGIDDKTYTVTVTTGLMEKLNDSLKLSLI